MFIKSYIILSRFLHTTLTRENKIRLHNSLIDVKFSIWSLTVPTSLNDGINIFAEGPARRICYREVLCYGKPHVLKLFLLFKDTIVTIYVLARNEQILAFGENRTHTTITNQKLEIARLKYARAKCDIRNNIYETFFLCFLAPPWQVHEQRQYSLRRKVRVIFDNEKCS